MAWLNGITFASDAEILAMVGLGFLLVAGLASLMERRRMKRREINRVGFMPWTTVFVLFAIIGGGMLAMSLPVVIGNL